MKKITELVRVAAGISETRGDKIEVSPVKFARATIGEGAKAPKKFDFDKNDIMRGVEILAMALIAIAMIFFVARPMIKGIFSDVGGNGKVGGMIAQGVGLPMGQSASIDSLPSNGDGSGGSSDTVDIARIQGAVNANAMKQVSDVVHDNPEQTVSVIRTWLQERRS